MLECVCMSAQYVCICVVCVTYSLPIVAKEHQACLGDDARATSPLYLQRLSLGQRTAGHQRGTEERYSLVAGEPKS